MEIKKLTETAILPTHGSKSAAGRDLYADSIEGLGQLEPDWTLQIQPGETVKVNTGIAIAIPDGFFGGIYPRSGLATKQGLAPANKVGVIDSDYRGPIIVALHNHSDMPQMIHQYDRIAQLILQPYYNYSWEVVDELDSTERGEGGFGSTGTN